MAAGTYDHLIKPLKSAEMPGMENMFKNTGNADVNRWLNGRDHLEGVELNFSWGFYTGLGRLAPRHGSPRAPLPRVPCFCRPGPAPPRIPGRKNPVLPRQGTGNPSIRQAIGHHGAGRVLPLPLGDFGCHQPHRLQLFHHLFGGQPDHPLAGRWSERRGDPATAGSSGKKRHQTAHGFILREKTGARLRRDRHPRPLVRRLDQAPEAQYHGSAPRVI